MYCERREKASTARVKHIYINIGLQYKTNVNPLNRLGPRILCVPRVNQYNIKYTRYYIHIYRARKVVRVSACVCAHCRGRTTSSDSSSLSPPSFLSRLYMYEIKSIFSAQLS